MERANHCVTVIVLAVSSCSSNKPKAIEVRDSLQALVVGLVVDMSIRPSAWGSHGLRNKPITSIADTAPLHVSDTAGGA